MFNPADLYLLLEILIPLSRRDLACVRNPSVFIDNFRFNNTEDLFGINITTLGARTWGFIRSVNNFVKVNHSLYGVAIINLKTTDIHDDEAIEHFEDVGGRLMNDHKHHLTTQGKFLQKVHDIFRIARRQS